jgi:quercetin dioxygenase-like cupin family protein
MAATPLRRGLVRADHAVPLIQGPLGALLLAGPDDTGGLVSFVVHDLAPRALGSPLHTHTREDEWSYVLAGEVGFEIEGTTSSARPGDLVLKPRQVPHAFWNAGDAPARLLEVITPGGFEEYFVALGEAMSAGPPDPQRMAAVADRFGLQIDRSSMTRLVQEHGLAMR